MIINPEEADFYSRLESMFEAGMSNEDIVAQGLDVTDPMLVMEDLVCLIRLAWGEKQLIKQHIEHVDTFEVFTIEGDDGRPMRISVECTKCGVTVAIVYEKEDE